MQIGDKVGRYSLERPLGEGGMGAVYLAYDPQTETRVVLKVLPADLTSPEMEARFKREIKSIAAIDHPNAVKVLDFQVSKDASFYTMPYIPVIDLARYVAILAGPGGAPPAASFGRLKDILVDVARALAHCHQREIYHRDIKPENILVDSKTHAGILADFGLARSANLTNITRTAQMLGTLRYMSPELMQGADVGAESDIYQLGLVAYEIFAGRLPLEAESPQKAAIRRISEEVPSPRTFNPVISQMLADLILWSLRVEPKERPDSMDTFAEGLAGLDPVDAEEAARTAAQVAPARHASRSISIPSLSSPSMKTAVGAPPAEMRSTSNPPTQAARSVSVPPGAVPASQRSGAIPAPGAPASSSGAIPAPGEPLPPGGPAMPRSRTQRSNPSLGMARARSGVTSPDRLSNSRQLSATMIADELAKVQRARRLRYGGAAAAVALVLGIAYWQLTPHGFAVKPGLQDAEVTGRGPEFAIELSEAGAVRTTVKPRQEAGGEWRAKLEGLKLGTEYSVCWVTPSGRRGGAQPFRTREVKLTDVTHALEAGGVKLSFKTSIPVRAAALMRGADASVDLDAKVATEHEGVLPVQRMRATELQVELTDETGSVARVTVGEITSPLALARRLALAVDKIDMEQSFMRIHGSVRGIARVGEMLAKDFREGPYRAVIEALDAFRLAGGAYFDDPDVPLADRIKMYRTLTKLSHLNGLLKLEGIPLEFPVDTLLGTTFAISGEDMLPGADPIRLLLPKNRQKFRRDMSKEFGLVSKDLGATAVKLGVKQDTEEFEFTTQLTDVKSITRAQVTLLVRYMHPLNYAGLEVNKQMQLEYHAPGYKEFETKVAIKLHHAFDPKLLREGDNTFRLRIGFTSNWAFQPLHLDGIVLKVERASKAN